MKAWKLKRRLACCLMCLSLILGLSVPVMAQAASEAAYTIYEDLNGVPQMVSTYPAAAGLAHAKDGQTETWYSLYEDLTVPTLNVSGGPINLILCDGAALTADSIQVEAGSSLTIWGQPAQGGKLVTSSVAGDLTFNGGVLKNPAAVNISGNLTVHGGEIDTAGLTVGGSLSVDGGHMKTSAAIHAKEVTVSDGFVKAHDLHAAGNLTVTGGQIQSSLDCGGTMSVTNAVVITDKAGSPASIGSGVLVTPDSADPAKRIGRVYGSPTLSTDLVVLSDMTLDIPAGQTLTMASGTTLTNLGTVTGEGTMKSSSVVNAEGHSIAGIDPKVVTTAKPLSSCKTMNEEQYSIEDSGVYVLDQDLTMDTLAIKDDINPTLILPNGLTLRTSAVSRPVSQDSTSKDSTGTLTLSEKSGPFGMLCSDSGGLSFNIQELIVNGGMVSNSVKGIQVKELTVNGGTVSSTTMEKNAIVVSGTLTVNGGSIQGTSQQIAGILAEFLTVTGGSVTGQNIKTVTSGQGGTDSDPINTRPYGILGNENVTISGGIVASRDSQKGKSDLLYLHENELSGGVLLCCDQFILRDPTLDERKVTVKDTVIMAKSLLPEDFAIGSGIAFSEKNGNLVGEIYGKFDQSSNQMLYPEMKTGFTIPERAVLRIDPDQELKLASGAVLHNKGDIINMNTGSNITGTITGNPPINLVDAVYMQDGVRTEGKAMVLNQKILDLCGDGLPQVLYILQENLTLELPQALMAPLRLILEDGVEVKLRSKGSSMYQLEIWGQEQNTGKLIHEDPLTLTDNLTLHGGSLSFKPDGSASTPDNTLTTGSLTVTGGTLCENGIFVDAGDAVLTGGAIEAEEIKLKNGSLNTTKEDGNPGTGWLTGTVQTPKSGTAGYEPITDYSPYSGVFIHDNVVEVRGNQALKADYTLPAGHAMTVYKKLTIPQGVTLTVPAGTSLTMNDTIECDGTIAGDGKFYHSGIPGQDNILVAQSLNDSMEYTGEALDIHLGAKKFGQIWEFPGWTYTMKRDNQSVTEVKDAGEYTITFSKEGETASVAKKFTVTPAAITGTIENVELVYNGKNQTVNPANNLNTKGNQPLTLQYGTAEGTYHMDAITERDAAAAKTYYYKAAAPNHHEKTGSFTVTVKQSASQITDLKAYNGQTETTTFTFGDTITVKAKPVVTGTVPVQGTDPMQPTVNLQNAVPAVSQMALYIHGIQVSEAVSPGNDGYYVMTLNTTDDAVRDQLKLGQMNEITAKFMGNANVAESSAVLSVYIVEKGGPVDLPKTGDASHSAVWNAAMALAAGTASILLIHKNKKNKKQSDR